MPPKTWKTSTSAFFLVIVHINTVCTYYALLSRVQLCRDYALFGGGHFGPKFAGWGHTNIFEDRDLGDHWSISPLVECQMLNVNKVKLLSERISGVPPVIFFLFIQV